MQKATFIIDGPNGVFEVQGYHDPASRWNGFANPFISKDDAVRFAELLVESDKGAGWDRSHYTVEGDDILVVTASEDEEFSTSFGPNENGLYSVGWGYTWLVKEEEEDSARGRNELG